MKNINQIKQSLNTMLGFYLEKRSSNRKKATMLSLNFVTFAANDTTAARILGGFFVTVTSLICSPAVPFTLIGYKIFGHTNHARVQPIKRLLFLLDEIALAEQQNQSIYRQKLEDALQVLPKVQQQIFTFPSESKQYRQLVIAANNINIYVQSRLKALDRQNAETMLTHGCRFLGGSKQKYDLGKSVDHIVYSFLSE